MIVFTFAQFCLVGLMFAVVGVGLGGALSIDWEDEDVRL